MKKALAVLISVILLAVVLTACSSKKSIAGERSAVSEKKISIVATIFPQYDWVREILGKKASSVDLTLLINDGVDLHSFQPTADDMIKISNCDMFIYVGGMSDKWVDGCLKAASNKNMVVINLLDVLGQGVKEEHVDGMTDEEHEEHIDETEKDEHVWLSVKNASVFCSYIADKLKELDPKNASAYSSNAAGYIFKLESLDKKLDSAVRDSAKNVLLFGDRFPFRYLVDDYGLSYYAAFAGCSAETEASFKTVTFLANKIDELNLSCVLTIEGSTHKIAETIISNTAMKNQQILALDSMQSVTGKDIANGVTYLSVMEKNLSVIKTALK